MKFYPLEVSAVTQETKDAVSVSFNVPADLQQVFNYQPGQYLTLKFLINGEEQRRAYSMCSSPIEKYITIGVKRVENGLVSNHINDNIQPGGKVEVMAPQGNFVANCQASHQKKYLLFGGGSGITPLFSIAKTVLAKEPNSTVKLLYANEDIDSIMFKNQLDELAHSYGTRFTVQHILNNAPEGWSGSTGWVDRNIIKTQFDNEFTLADTECYICGPSGMMELVKNSLKELQVPSNKIHLEYFVAPTTSSDTSVVAEAINEARVKVDFFGEEHTLMVPKGQSILEALKKNGIDAPFSCQSGVCSTCIAKLAKGEVAMDFSEALDDDEIADGYILTCQSKCITEELEVIFED